MKKFSAKTVVVIAIGAALFGVGGLLSIPVFANTTLRPAAAVLAIFAAMYGPVVGLLVGLLGHTLTDLFGGWGFWPSWIVGSGIVGLIIGYFKSYSNNGIEEGTFNHRDMGIFVLLGFTGNFIGYSVSALIDALVYSEPLAKVITQQLLSSVLNTLMIGLIGTTILAIVAKRNSQEQDLSEENDEAEE